MRSLRNTERVLNNAAVERIEEIEREKGADIKIEDIAELVSGVYPVVMTKARWMRAPGAAAWSPA